MSRTNETRYTEQHGTCKCKCRLDTSVCNDKERWNKVCLCVYLCVCVRVFVCVIKDLFGTEVIVTLNVINHVTLEST